MTTTEVRTADQGVEAPDEQSGPQGRRRRLVVLTLTFVVLAAALGFLVGNEIQANTQFDETHHTLDVTQAGTMRVDAKLSVVRGQLSDLQGQVSQDSAVLATDTTELNSVKVALANSLATVSRQSSDIGNLHTCLGGVEEALNALSVGDQNHALAALDAVATSCDSAVAADA